MLVQESAVGPLPLPRGRVGVQGPADDQPCGGDLLDAEQVNVGQRAAWSLAWTVWSLRVQRIRSPALAWVLSAMRTADPAATTPRRIMTDLGQARQFGQTVTWLREARRVRAAALIAAMGTPLGRGGCMRGADGYLLAKLASSYSCPLTSGLGGVRGDGREARAGSAVSLRDQRGCPPRCGVPALSGWPGRHRHGRWVVPG